tara:strand:- start:47 stop:259 length:213 start_codon:yes stop_codon:yes gene_type:complete
MATDKQKLYWLAQSNKVPSTLHWYAKVNDNNEVIELLAQDELFHTHYSAYPELYTNFKPATEDTNIGDIL